MFNEDNTVEQMLIEAATQSSWQYVKSQDIPRSSDSVLVESWLLEALVRLNPITRQQAEQVIYKLRAAITCGGNYDELVTANWSRPVTTKLLQTSLSWLPSLKNVTWPTTITC